jgi:hypothetical protein
MGSTINDAVLKDLSDTEVSQEDIDILKQHFGASRHLKKLTAAGEIDK